ncbi:MAG: tRNA uridine-5-carboxymethylaminomethyl(34) synthesis GTPase MnmE [Bacteroidota bacterium]
MIINNQDTICAISSPSGVGAIAIIRISGSNAFKIAKSISSIKDLLFADNKLVKFAKIYDATEIIDEVIIIFFKSPNSYTGDDLVEISCHGSSYIQERIVQLILREDARYAEPGEFTLRAFINGKMDLTQAEAVADLISSNSASSHKLAINQMRGGFSNEIAMLREELLNFSSLMELELDFGEEDVEFADRDKFNKLIEKIKIRITELIKSFELGNVIKKGIPVAIVGKPNVGKSTLLNAILNEERAIVSDIPGTTRDTIEDVLIIDGVSYRFIDTAGLRDSSDEIETKGIERTYDCINSASIILYVVDISVSKWEEIEATISDFKKHIINNQKIVLIANKTDMLVEAPKKIKNFLDIETIFISAKRKENISLIKDVLLSAISVSNVNDISIVTNIRHLDSLKNTLDSIDNIEKGISQQIPTDLLAIDIRKALHHLAEITGAVTTDEILSTIFGKFCIGK